MAKKIRNAILRQGNVFVFFFRGGSEYCKSISVFAVPQGILKMIFHLFDGPQSILKLSVLIISQPVANVFEMLLHRRDSLPEAGYFIYMEARAFPVADHFCSREALVSIPAVGHGALHRRALLTARGPSCIKGGNAQCAARSRMGETRAGSPPTDGTAGDEEGSTFLAQF